MNTKEIVLSEILLKELDVKGVTDADRKLVANFIVPLVAKTKTLIENPFSGESTTTTTLKAALVNFVYDISNGLENNPSSLCEKYGFKSMGAVVAAFDRARYLILKLDRKIYSAFID